MMCGKGGISKSNQMIPKLVVIITKGDEKKQGKQRIGVIKRLEVAKDNATGLYGIELEKFS